MSVDWIFVVPCNHNVGMAMKVLHVQISCGSLHFPSMMMCTHILDTDILNPCGQLLCVSLDFPCVLLCNYNLDMEMFHLHISVFRGLFVYMFQKIGF